MDDELAWGYEEDDFVAPRQEKAAPSSCTSELHCSLPPIPQPKVLRRVMPDDYRYGDVMGYTARQMKEYAKRAIREANKRITEMDCANTERWN